MEGGPAHGWEKSWCAFGVPPPHEYKGGGESQAARRGVPWGESYLDSKFK